ncbi:hypothetical protein ACNKHK_03800 [Shigella flexneri]
MNQIDRGVAQGVHTLAREGAGQGKITAIPAPAAVQGFVWSSPIIWLK